MSRLIKSCVVGWPIRHSRSPLIHRHWLDVYGIQGCYGVEAVEPDNFADFISRLPGRGYAGCNVTLPHKEAAARIVSRCDETARKLGAVNTIWCENGGLAGANTDVYGFLANLDEAAPGWDSGLGRAVVLGAGGAARGVVHGLLSRGIGDVAVVNRNAGRLAGLVETFGQAVSGQAVSGQAVSGQAVSGHGWADLASVLDGARLLVNTTSLGMEGAPPLDIDLSPLAADAVVNDIVYVPLRTGLLKAARARRLAAVDGLGMLLHQAVPGFEKWFGVRPQVTPELRAILVADIEAA